MKAIIIAIIATLSLSSCSYFGGDTKSVTPTLDELNQRVTSYREEKATLQWRIVELDIKIIRDKCEVFKRTKAAAQWEIDCKPAFEAQVETLKNAEVQSVVPASMPEEDPEMQGAQ